MYLEEIVDGINIENEALECKRVLNRNDINGWIKTVAGFANSHGGDLYIGVEDKTNMLIGFDREAADGERNYFNNQVNEHVIPRPTIKTGFIGYNIRGTERFILHIRVEESAVKPVIVKFNNVPSIYMRRDGFTNGATYEEIIEMSIKSSRTQYDVLLSDKKYAPDDFNDLRAYYSLKNNGRELKEKALSSMGFYDEEGMLYNGAVLFSDDYHGGKTEVQCSVFSGFTRGSERIVTVNRFDGNITRSIEFMMDFVRQRMNTTIVKLGDMRQSISAYPKRALFEAVVNAVAHRDYYLDGTQIQLDIFRDRLEISSPGGFYRGEKIGKTYDLSKIISKRRNELISSVLVQCNVMEAAGTGFDKISEEYAPQDESHKPFIYSSADHFTLVLPDLTYAEGLVDSDTPEIIFEPVLNGTDKDKKILSFCYTRSRKAAEIAEYLGISDSSYLRNKVLGNLVSQGFLEKNRQGNTIFYKTDRKKVKTM